MDAIPMVDIWRGPFVESVHHGWAAIWQADTGLVQAWGDPETVILPRSSCKMVQAVPLVASGAADAARLTSEQLALACASHEGAAIHTDRVLRWLADLDLPEDAFLCGPQAPRDRAAKFAMIRADETPCRRHNNCSGKHCGFLTLSRHLGGGPDYVALDHPVQQAIRSTFEDLTDHASPGHAIDGCSAPNFATTLAGLARAMAVFAAATGGGDSRDRAMHRLVGAMMAHPDLVAGTGRACTELMQALAGRGAVKTGAEGVFVAILPGPGMGVAVKAADGATRAAECMIAAILVRLGVLDPNHPATLKRMNAPIRNFAGEVTGHIRPAAALLA